MTDISLKSMIIVGGGITGLTLAVVAQARGWDVTVVARDPVEETASGVAAGMIAPALEALNDADPRASFHRLKAAQAAWFDLMDLWPQPVQVALSAPATSHYLCMPDEVASVRERLDKMAVEYEATDQSVSVAGEHLIDARAVLRALQTRVRLRTGKVTAVDATSVTLDDGESLTADTVVLATGFDTTLAADVPCLAHLTPIKGHILDLPGQDETGQGGAGVVRSALGYLADYGALAKFGATMEAGRSDLSIDPHEVEGLKARAQRMVPDLDTSRALPRTGIRAASPNAWPMIGRDAVSGVYVATAMRRNGYVFAPLAARLILDLIDGMTSPEAALYDPNRFS